jgi:hypothetical protein
MSIPRPPMLVMEAILKIIPSSEPVHHQLAEDLDTLRLVRGNDKMAALAPAELDVMSWGYLVSTLENRLPLHLVHLDAWRSKAMQIFNAEIDYRDFLI